METFLHTPNNLYTYIKNNQNMADLQAQIEENEKDLDLLEESIERYEKANFTGVVEVLSKSYNKLMQKTILLKLELNKLEKQNLLFELQTLTSN